MMSNNEHCNRVEGDGDKRYMYNISTAIGWCPEL